MIDRFFNRLGIGLALAFMVTELSYINYKSLYYLTDGTGALDRVFAIIGSLAFSLVTVVVMRKSDSKVMKLIFPVFDTLLVFCGLNLSHAQDIAMGSDNPIRFMLTIFMAVFAGFIVYGLGIINYKEKTESVSRNDKERISELIGKVDDYRSKLRKAESEIMTKDSEMKDMKSKIEVMKTQIDKSKSEVEIVKSEFNGKESEFIKYKTIYLQAERSRILKKKPENRTKEEVELLGENI